MHAHHRSAEALTPPVLPLDAAGALYDFVYLDQGGHVVASDQYPHCDDEAARAHAQRLLAGATLVVVYRDGARICLLANLC